MTSTEESSSIASALQAVEALRAAAEAQQQSRIAAFDDEIARLQRNIENLHAQIATLREARAAADGEGEGLAASWHAEGASRIFDALRAQAAALAERTVAWTEAGRALAANRDAALKSSEVAPILEEYEQFRRDIEPTLASLPASYRNVLQAHHDSIKERLQAHLDKLPSEPTLDAEPLRLDVVFACDDEIVMLLTPVADEVQSRWAERDADLQTRLAATIVEGLYTALRGTPLEASEAAFGGHEGLLAMEVELTPEVVGFEQRLRDAMRQALDAAADVAAARVQVALVQVGVDLLLPPDDDDEGADEG